MSLSMNEKRRSRVLDAVSMFEQMTPEPNTNQPQHRVLPKFERKLSSRSYSFEPEQSQEANTTNLDVPKSLHHPTSPTNHAFRAKSVRATTYAVKPIGEVFVKNVEVPTASKPPRQGSQTMRASLTRDSLHEEEIPMPTRPPPKPEDDDEDEVGTSFGTLRIRVPAELRGHRQRYEERRASVRYFFEQQNGNVPQGLVDKARSMSTRNIRTSKSEPNSPNASFDNLDVQKVKEKTKIWHMRRPSGGDPMALQQNDDKKKNEKKEKKSGIGKLSSFFGKSDRLEQVKAQTGEDFFSTRPVKLKEWNQVEVKDRSTIDSQFMSLIDTAKVDAEGFKIEWGNNSISYPNSINIEDPDRDVPYFKDYFAEIEEGCLHLVADGDEDKVLGPVILTIQLPALEKEDRKAILRTKRGNERFIIPAENSGNVKDMQKFLKTKYSDIMKVKLKKVQDQELTNRLAEIERQSIITKYKFGILYVKEGQKDENEMFSNNEPGKAYTEFLSWIGEKIELKGWPSFRGGLDVKNNTTGTHSVYTMHEGAEIMFHVSTLLPFQPNDLQRVERKRHLGNDIVVIIFKEGDQPFDPLCLTTHFNHVFCIISVDKQFTTPEKTFYKVVIANKAGVPPYGPWLKYPPVYEKDDEFRNFLLTKLINSERCAIANAPDFKNKMLRTQKQILEDLAKQFSGK